MYKLKIQSRTLKVQIYSVSRDTGMIVQHNNINNALASAKYNKPNGNQKVLSGANCNLRPTIGLRPTDNTILDESAYLPFSITLILFSLALKCC